MKLKDNCNSLTLLCFVYTLLFMHLPHAIELSHSLSSEIENASRIAALTSKLKSFSLLYFTSLSVVICASFCPILSSFAFAHLRV